MSYFLKQFNTALLQFQMHKTLGNISTEIMWVNEAKVHLLQHDLKATEKSLARWLESRNSSRACPGHLLNLQPAGYWQSTGEGLTKESCCIRAGQWVLLPPIRSRTQNFMRHKLPKPWDCVPSATACPNGGANSAQPVNYLRTSKAPLLQSNSW